MLCDEYLEMIPFSNNELGQLTKVDKTEKISFLTFEPSIF